MVCKECGASIGEEYVKCPFCEALQYKAAEKEYMNELEVIHEDLGNLKTEGKKTFLKVFFLTFLKTAVLSLFFMFLGAASYWGNKAEEEAAAEKEDVKKVIKFYEWYEEHITELDVCYQDRDFEKINNIISQSGRYDGLSTWSHMDISKLYIEITQNIDRVTKDMEEGWVTEWSMGRAINAALELIYACSENNIYYNVSIENLDSEEKEVLAEWRSTAHTFLYETLKMSEEEVLAAEDKACDNGRYQYDALLDIVREKLSMLELE